MRCERSLSVHHVSAMNTKERILQATPHSTVIFRIMMYQKDVEPSPSLHMYVSLALHILKGIEILVCTQAFPCTHTRSSQEYQRNDQRQMCVLPLFRGDSSCRQGMNFLRAGGLKSNPWHFATLNRNAALWFRAG